MMICLDACFTEFTLGMSHKWQLFQNAATLNKALMLGVHGL